MIQRKPTGLISRRAFAAAVALAGAVRAQDRPWPNRPVKIIVPLPAGTANDVATRALAQKLSERWQQPVVVENRPGASTIIGVNAVAKSPADGYTLLSGTSQMAQNVTLRRKLPYDFQRELVPIAQIYRTNLGLFARSGFPVSNLIELIAYAKANPGKVNFGSWGEGSTGHLVLEAMQRQAGVQLVHVPYKGGPDALAALMAGDIDVTISNMLGATQHVRSGKFKLVGVTGTRRMQEFPSAQAFAEVGVEGFEATNWQGMFAPTGTPEAIVAKLTGDIHEVLSDKTLVSSLDKQLEIEVTGTAGREFRQLVERDIATWRKVISMTGIVLD